MPTLSKTRIAKNSRTPLRKRALQAGLAASIAGALALVAAPVAQAASITYAHNAPLSQFQVRDSGMRSSMTGGVAAPDLFSADGASVQAAIETYNPAPGYRTVGFTYGGQTARLSHARASNVHSKCWWEWPWSMGHDIGRLPTTCSFNY